MEPITHKDVADAEDAVRKAYLQALMEELKAAA